MCRISGVGQVSQSASHFSSQRYSTSAPYYSLSTKLLVLLLSSIIALIGVTVNTKTEGTRRQRSRLTQLLDDFKEKRNYWNLKAEVQDCTLGELVLKENMKLS